MRGIKTDKHSAIWLRYLARKSYYWRRYHILLQFGAP